MLLFRKLVKAAAVFWDIHLLSERWVINLRFKQETCYRVGEKTLGWETQSIQKLLYPLQIRCRHIWVNVQSNSLSKVLHGVRRKAQRKTYQKLKVFFLHVEDLIVLSPLLFFYNGLEPLESLVTKLQKHNQNIYQAYQMIDQIINDLRETKDNMMKNFITGMKWRVK